MRYKLDGKSVVILKYQLDSLCFFKYSHRFLAVTLPSPLRLHNNVEPPCKQDRYGTGTSRPIKIQLSWGR